MGCHDVPIDLTISPRYLTYHSTISQSLHPTIRQSHLPGIRTNLHIVELLMLVGVRGLGEHLAAAVLPAGLVQVVSVDSAPGAAVLMEQAPRGGPRVGHLT